MNENGSSSQLQKPAGTLRYGVSAAVLKYLAVISMLVDHTAHALYALPAIRPAYQSMRFIGRFAFPVYCFFIVEGFEHTHSRWKYLRNLCIFAALSQVPFVKALFPQNHILGKLNVYFTLVLGLICIWVLDNAMKAGSRRELHAAAAALCVCALAYAAHRLSVDYRYGGVLLIVLFYLLRKHRALALLAGYIWISYYNPTEVFAFPAFLLLMLYSGKRGRQNKWLFYAFYPAHLAVLAVLRVKFGI